MMCPFSARVCEECAVYRGRHYYLCFCQEYRGYLGAPGKSSRHALPPVPGLGSNGQFEMPSVIRVRPLDPFVSEGEGRPRKEE
jgi:hypothetical protein